jgi:hypothetical protein
VQPQDCAIADRGEGFLRTNFRAPTSIDKEAIKRRAYLDQNFLAISLDDPRLSWADKLALKAIADSIYGDAGPGRHA